jgi:hypothetical protein
MAGKIVAVELTFQNKPIENGDRLSITFADKQT